MSLDTYIELARRFRLGLPLSLGEREQLYKLASKYENHGLVLRLDQTSGKS